VPRELLSSLLSSQTISISLRPCAYAARTCIETPEHIEFKFFQLAGTLESDIMAQHDLQNFGWNTFGAEHKCGRGGPEDRHYWL